MVESVERDQHILGDGVFGEKAGEKVNKSRYAIVSV